MGTLGVGRIDYARGQLRDADVAPTWPEQFDRWFAEAREALREPHAMVLATTDGHGRARARTVLLKAYDATGLMWASNYTSRKGRDLDAVAYAGLCFSWLDLERQVHFEGPVARASAAESDEIFAGRPRGAQLSAWASHQSQPVASRAVLAQAYHALEQRFPAEVPRPAFWGAYRLAPVAVEFWQGNPDRLHDRVRWRVEGEAWVRERLAP